MLSRVASELYWLARHLERAENIARILEVNQSLSMLTTETAKDRETEAMLEPIVITDTLSAFQLSRQANVRINAEEVSRFLVWDTGHPSSIARCLELARDNAKSVRGSITSEMWECINDTWLQLQHFRKKKTVDTAFFDWVKERAHLFTGVTSKTLQRGQPYSFLRLGTYIERADNTARILSVKQLGEKEGMPEHQPHLLGDNASLSSGRLGSYYRLGALLRSVSAMEAYNDIYRDVFIPAQVVELLVYAPSLPRSLRFCLDEIVRILGLLPSNRGKEARKLAGLLHARLVHGDLQDISLIGLSAFLDQFIHDNYEFATAVHSAYLGLH